MPGSTIPPCMVDMTSQAGSVLCIASGIFPRVGKLRLGKASGLQVWVIQNAPGACSLRIQQWTQLGCGWWATICSPWFALVRVGGIRCHGRAGARVATDSGG